MGYLRRDLDAPEGSGATGKDGFSLSCLLEPPWVSIWNPDPKQAGPKDRGLLAEAEGKAGRAANCSMWGPRARAAQDRLRAESLI